MTTSLPSRFSTIKAFQHLSIFIHLSPSILAFGRSLCCILFLCVIPGKAYSRTIFERDSKFLLLCLAAIIAYLLIRATIDFIVKMVEMAGRLVKTVFSVLLMIFMFAVYTNPEGTAMVFRTIAGFLIYLVSGLFSLFDWIWEK